MKKFIFILFFFPKFSCTNMDYFRIGDRADTGTSEAWASAYNIKYCENVDLNKKSLQKSYHSRSFGKQHIGKSRYRYRQNDRAISEEEIQKIKSECEECRNEYDIQKNKFLDNAKKRRFMDVTFSPKYKKSFDAWISSCKKCVSACKKYNMDVSHNYMDEVIGTIFGGINEPILFLEDYLCNDDFFINYITDKFRENFRDDEKFMQKFFDRKRFYLFSYVLSMSKKYKRDFLQFSSQILKGQQNYEKFLPQYHQIAECMPNFISKISLHDENDQYEWLYPVFYNEFLSECPGVESITRVYEGLKKYNKSCFEKSYTAFVKGINDRSCTFDGVKNYIIELARFYRKIFLETFLCIPYDYSYYKNSFIIIFTYAAFHFRSFYDIMKLRKPEWNIDGLIQVFFSELLKNDDKIFSLSSYRDFCDIIKYIMYGIDTSTNTKNEII